jgi:hypothetical protein
MARKRRRGGIFGRLRDSRKKRAVSKRNRNRNTKPSPLNYKARRRLRKLKKQKGRVQPTLGITKPINNQTKPKLSVNELGLKSNLPQISLSDRPKDLNEVEKQKDIVTKLDEGTQDNETVNILDRGIELMLLMRYQ